MDLEIIASKFIGLNTFGDFNYMIKQDMLQKDDPLILYIYNDNTESYYNHSFRRGKGNAIIREYNKFNPNLQRPYSAGIPTGNFKSGGFSELSEDVVTIINKSITIIKNIINKYKIKTIYYSTNNKSGILGKSLFDVDESVLKFITLEIQKLSIYPIIIKVNDD